MLFKFFGGAQEVGRSSILLKDSSSLLLDFGIKLSAEKPEYPVDIPEVDAVVLSHAHIDHSGAIPTLYNDTFPPTFGTVPTLELSELLLEDSLEVARKEHTQPHFHKRQIKTMSNRYVPLAYGATASFRNFDLTLSDAGHICGSAITLIERKAAKDNARIAYTGDFKSEPQYLHKGAKPVKADLLVTESTYAMREHPPREDTIKSLVERVKEVIDNGGNVVLPSFAVGRAQELLVLMYRNGLIDLTFVDGMARTATKIALKHRDAIDNWEWLSSAVPRATFVEAQSDRAEALRSPSVIITTAGMLNGGPVVDYITRLNHNSEILLTGYQVEGTNGRNLLERGTVRIDGNERKVHVKSAYYDLSAHAGKSELYDYVKACEPTTVICVHGDHEASTSMAESLKLEGYEAYAPKIGETLKFE
ncbi:MAG: MBL fold metallo-hydrolase [Candidatus Micrarchaeota archaeon]|nr:MBL fold metallo-hydrolase [Candidatus Micrarchaeota archaeon]